VIQNQKWINSREHKRAVLTTQQQVKRRTHQIRAEGKMEYSPQNSRRKVLTKQHFVKRSFHQTTACKEEFSPNNSR